MEIKSVVGRWELIGTTSVNGEIAFLGDEPDPNGVSNWLNGLGEDLEASVKHVSAAQSLLHHAESPCLQRQSAIGFMEPVVK